MRGTFTIAYKLLVNDRGKFMSLLLGITFSVFLMVQMTSLFSGIMKKASATVTNTGSRMWVMDRSVDTVANSIPLPESVLDAVRSIDGVRYAVPFYTGSGLVKLRSGRYQAVNVIGLDDASLLGRPRLLEGQVTDVYAESGFWVVRDEEYKKLESPIVGTDFEINDNRGVVVGLAHVAASGLFGMPTLYTTFTRAVQYVPSSRNTISYILVDPKRPEDEEAIKAEVAALGYSALTEDEFTVKISRFYMFRTGLGMNIMLMTVVAFVVGLSISGQTFYSFVLENLEKFGALKAIGARGRVLVSMILFQAGLMAAVGYGLGLGLCSLLIAIAKLRLPDYAATITFPNLAIAFGMVVLIASLSGTFAVRRVLRIEPFDIFRG